MGVFHGNVVVVLTSQTEVLVCRCFFRLVGADWGICDGYVARPSSGRCGAAVVKNGLGHFCFIVLYLPPKPSGRGEATPWQKTLDAVYKWTDG